MSLLLAQMLAVALLAVLLLQVVLTFWFVAVVALRLRQRHSWLPDPEGGWPAAEVVMCLKGADPTLTAALEALAMQRYPGHWRLQLVVDSPLDPAWTQVHRLVERLARDGQATWVEVRITPLAGRPAYGSLKSASLCQAFSSLHPDTQLVALVDADAVVATAWLAALARACWQPGIGAVSGNRWYVPERSRLPGLVRATWNAGALVLMTLLGIAWGGSLAVRREVIDAGPWCELLRTSLCEDTALAQPLRQLGWRYVFRPELLVVDCDDGIDLDPLSRWIARQLLTVRLHHRGWPVVAAHGLLNTAVVMAATIALLVSLAVGQTAAAVLLAVCLVAYALVWTALLLLIESVALGALQPTGSCTGDRPLLRRTWNWFCSVPVTCALYGRALLGAARARRVEWRGVIYRVRDKDSEGTSTVEIIGY